MMNQEPKKRPANWVIALGAIGLIILFGGMICDIISDFSSVIPESDWYKVAILIGWPTSSIAQYFSPITDKDIKNGDAMWWIFNIIPLLFLFHIDHFTTPVIVGTVVGCIVIAVAIVLARKRHLKILALQEQQEQEKEN